jgi:hypothetical protein
MVFIKLALLGKKSLSFTTFTVALSVEEVSLDFSISFKSFLHETIENKNKKIN